MAGGNGSDRYQAEKNLEEIKKVIDRNGLGVHGKSGWFFIVWGTVWLSGFIVNQFSPKFAEVLWPLLNGAGILISIFLTVAMFGRRAPLRKPGLTKSIIFSVVGYTLFGAVAISLLNLETGRDIAILLVFAASLAFFQVGMVVNRRISLLGILLILVTGFADFLVPDYLFLAIGIGGAAVFYGIGASALLKAKV